MNARQDRADDSVYQLRRASLCRLIVPVAVLERQTKLSHTKHEV